ncbi:Long-chain-fatty-acid--CoA ligase FadD13 [compost metagenome]
MPASIHAARTVYELLHASAAVHAEGIALTYLDDVAPLSISRQLSYAELFAELNRTVRLIHDLAGKPRPVVSLLLPHLPQSQCLLWGAACAGVANPLNPLLNEDALYGLMLKAETDLIFVLGPVPGSDLWDKARAVAERLPRRPSCVAVAMPAGELCYDRLLADYSPEPLAEHLLPAPQDTAAYFHTGGTTGLPKLARHSHANQVAAALAYVRSLRVGPDDVAINGLPLFHVAGALVNSLGGLAGGVRLVLPTPAGFRNPEVIRQHWHLVERFGVTVSGGIPTSVAAMLDVPLDGHDIGTLRFLLSGGAPVSAALCESVRAVTGLQLYQAYGMTEAAGVIALPNLDAPAIPGSAGHIAAPIEVRIDGGEICVRGPTVFPGYLGQDTPPLDDGWLRSGDLGHLDEHGNLFITGRAKDLIIRGGHNIDPSLIESCLERHPAVSLVAAVGMPDEYAGELPVAFVQLRPGCTATAEELQTYALAHIAERPACPKRIFLVDSLPVTTVGKIFKPQLREQAAASLFGERALAHCGALGVRVSQAGDGALELRLSGVPADRRDWCVALARDLNLRLMNLDAQG